MHCEWVESGALAARNPLGQSLTLSSLNRSYHRHMRERTGAANPLAAAFCFRGNSSPFQREKPTKLDPHNVRIPRPAVQDLHSPNTSRRERQYEIREDGECGA